jgi:hypothetical protein
MKKVNICFTFLGVIRKYIYGRGKKMGNSVIKPYSFKAKIFVFLLMLSLVVVFTNKMSIAGEEKSKNMKGTTVSIGDLDFTELAPVGMVNVLGLDPKADAFFNSLDKSFKLIVIGAYCHKDDYMTFVNAMNNKQYKQIPNIAVVAIPKEMHKKSYDRKSATREMKRYINWFTLATNTKPLAYGMEIKANSSFKKKLDLDLDFSYKVGKFSKIFNQTTSSLAVGILMSVNLNGEKSENYLAVSSFHVADKIVFISMFGQDNSEQGIDRLRTQLLDWRDKLTAINPPPMIVKEAKAKAVPKEAEVESGTTVNLNNDSPEET